MSRWQVELTGHQFDLEDLPRWFTLQSSAWSNKTGTSFFEAKQFDDLHESAVHGAARELLPRINGVAKLKNGSFRHVAVGATVRELDEEGVGRQHAVVLAGTVELRSRVGAVVVRVGENEPTAPAPGSLTQISGYMRPRPTPMRERL